MVFNVMADNWDKCKTLGDKGVYRTKLYLKSVGQNPVDIVDGRQFTHGDIETESGFIEAKNETKWTGNLFIETWSNKPKRRGWLFNLTHCDMLFYFFGDKRNRVHILDMQKLRRTFIDGEDINKVAVISSKSYGEIQQKKHHQKNDTWGLLVKEEWLISKGIGELHTPQSFRENKIVPNFMTHTEKRIKEQKQIPCPRTQSTADWIKDYEAQR
jgi:hypothetical protein